MVRKINTSEKIERQTPTANRAVNDAQRLACQYNKTGRRYSALGLLIGSILGLKR